MMLILLSVHQYVNTVYRWLCMHVGVLVKSANRNKCEEQKKTKKEEKGKKKKSRKVSGHFY